MHISFDEFILSLTVDKYDCIAIKQLKSETYERELFPEYIGYRNIHVGFDGNYISQHLQFLR